MDPCLTLYGSRIASVCSNPIWKLENETVASSCRHMRTLAAETARCTKALPHHARARMLQPSDVGQGLGWDLSC